MAEILTESFCERCGTRYTFQTAAPRGRRLRKLRVLSRGLRNYVLSDETSFEEAFADARSDEERALSHEQLDAFHQTFNFCMSCRQYTCSNCWNAAEGRCLTCAPDLSREVLPAPFPTLDTSVEPLGGVGRNGQAEREHVAAGPAPGAWPVVDLARPAPRAPAEVTVGPESTAEPEIAAEPAIEPAPALEVAAELEVAAAAAPPETPEVAEPPTRPMTPSPAAEPAAGEKIGDLAAAAATRTKDLLARFRPGRQIEAEVAPTAAIAGEANVEAPTPVEVEPAAPEVAVAAVAEVAEASEPVVSEAPTPVAPEPAAPEPAAPRHEDRVEVPVWRLTAPETPETQTPTPPRPTPQWPAAPQWPATPQWPPTAAPAPPERHPRLGSDAMWVASSRDVIERPGSGVQACISCGLPLSASARFCRRCGSRQD